MTFSDAIQNLTDGRAAKPGTWGGYVARVDQPPAFSASAASAAYAVGDLVSYDGKAYCCSSAHSTGAWNSSHFAELFTLLQEFSEEAPSYDVGAKVLRDGMPYECTAQISAAGAWDSSKWRALPDVPHALVFQERSDADGDSATVYVAACGVSLSGGRQYGAFSPAFAMDAELLRAIVWDTTWAMGDKAAYEAARTGTSRW